ncbi:Hint domain-containing protein [Actinomadura decatromicini]|uniref:Hint domain-containing protein n=1 Tax=Actinomadura decatromicini TaxID=2604572 RepID=A0A5D3FA13_9ACTN|nr:Hint domain-containing protein [Actinomadura decatromicini]TYK45161.1 hypothetical protein FXF68_31275 [Actinomadura decatromicini]
MSLQSRAAEYHRQQLKILQEIAKQIAASFRLVRLGSFGSTVPAWLRAADAAITKHADMAGSLAADYFESERELARVPGTFHIDVPDVPETKIDTSLRWATKDLWIPQRDSPPPIERRLADAETKVIGAAQKAVADTARDTIHQGVLKDRRAIAWARITDSDPCYFCALMALRGAVFKSRQTAGRRANRNFEGEGQYKFHDHCVPAGTLVDGPAAEVGYRRDYEGELVVLRTAAGHELRITPNHPVLTVQGWLPAGLLREGDDVLSSLNAQGSLLSVPDEEHVPALVQDVWRAMGMLGLVSVPGTPEDFHGDGTDSKVDVVGADRFLRDHIREADVATELSFTASRMGLGPFPLLRAQDAFFHGDVAPADCRVSIFDHVGALFVGERSHRERTGRTPIARLNPLLDQDPPDHWSRGSVPGSERELAFTGEVCGDHVGRWDVCSAAAGRNPTFTQLPVERAGGYADGVPDLGSGHAADVQTDRLVKHGPISGSMSRFDPATGYGDVGGAGVYAKYGRDLLERLSGRVESDRIVDLSHREFRGQVFNFQTESGWYRANGVIVSNCSCTVAPVFEGKLWVPPSHVQDWEQLYEQATAHVGDKMHAWRKAFDARG